MGSRETAWLRGELPKLVAEGILSSETASALAQRYAAEGEEGARKTAWGQVLLTGFGALLVGGGICLILAHNWDVLSRAARAALVIGGLVAAQGLAAFALVRRERSPAWIEATSGLLVTAVGTALALVSQTYHIPGTLDGFYRTWLWLIVAIPYLTGSVVASVLLWALIVVRATSTIGPWDVASSEAFEPWLVAAAGLPFVVQAIRRHGSAWSTALLAWACAVGVFVLGIQATTRSRWDGLWAVYAVAFFAALYAAATWPPDAEGLEAWRKRIGRPAAFGLLLVGIILSFEAPWRHLDVQASFVSARGAMAAAIVSALCIAIASVLAVRLWLARERHVALWAAGAPLVAVAHVIAVAGNEDLPWIAFNVWLVAAGIASLTFGVRENRFGPANQGLAAVAMVVGARFFDVELSFLARGIGFVALGIACLALNLVLMRRARKVTA